jgi:hypothetical protein
MSAATEPTDRERFIAQIVGARLTGQNCVWEPLVDAFEPPLPAQLAAVAKRVGREVPDFLPRFLVAVDPARDLAAYIGEHTTWQDPAERFFFEPGYVDELRALTPAQITRPERYYAVIAQGDEVLDWREMCGRYPGAHIQLLEGGDHALSDFSDHIGEALGFLGL